MARFALECPHCGTLNKASTFPFAKKTIVCGNCKQEIDVASNRMAVGECAKCGTVAYDRAKGVCPVCHEKILINGKASSLEDLKSGAAKMPLVKCPECGCHIQPSKNGTAVICPVCDHDFGGYEGVFREIQKEKLVSEKTLSVIKYEGGNDVFIWKHPIEDFNFGSQLIVHESQEAIFFMNGQALDTFGPGRYSLETENMPILSKAFELPTGKQNPFHAEVYFVNKAVQMGLKWGTDSRVRFIDPQTQLPLDIGASGEMNLTVKDSRKLLIKLVGTSHGIAWDSDEANFSKSLKNCFRPHILTTIKTHLASAIESQNIDILTFDKHLETLSAALGERLADGFDDFGLGIENFYVSNISLPDEDDQNFKTILNLRQYGARQQVIEKERQTKLAQESAELEIERLKTLETARIQAEQAKIQAQAQAEVMTMTGSAEIELQKQKGFTEAQVMAAKGYTQKDVLEADVRKAFAEGLGQMGANGGANGGIMSDMMGLAMGVTAAQTMGGQMNEMIKGFNNPADSDSWDCTCGQKGISGKFCSSCGAPKPEAWDCACGNKGITGKFCSQCGKAKPETWDCPHCNAKGLTGNFCSQCGKTRAQTPDTWDCDCGNKGIKGKFCSECGKKREDN